MDLPLPGPFVTLLLKTASTVSGWIGPRFVDRALVERRANLRYGERREQRLDVYVPRSRGSREKLPVSILVHGGGFRFFSKNSHAAAAARLAESGRVVFCIDYRLSPKHAFPLGLVDAIEAYHWVLANASRHSGDVSRLSLIGESSGAGFIASLCLSFFGLARFPDSASLPPVPKTLPKAVVLHCGYYEVCDIERFRDDARCHGIARTRVRQIRKNYLPEYRDAAKPEWALADPGLVYANLAKEGRNLPAGFPAVFIPVGSEDPVIGDSERLAEAFSDLRRSGCLKIYPGGGHAFYASPSGKQAKACWADIVTFLDRSDA